MINKNGKLVSSYSQINLYKQCPFRWHLKYQKKIRSELRSKHLEYGLVVHETYEDFFNVYQKGDMMDKPNLLALYDFQFHSRGIPFDNQDENQEYYRLGYEAMERLVDKNDEFNTMLVESKIIGVEEGIVVNIAGVDIVGYIDLILENDNGIATIDHKTSSKVFPKSKLKKDLQFQIYAMAIHEKYGELPYSNYYNFTKLNKNQEVVTTSDTIDLAKQGIVKTFESMSKAKHRAKPCPLCYWCDYSTHKMNICPHSSSWMPKNK